MIAARKYSAGETEYEIREARITDVPVIAVGMRPHDIQECYAHDVTPSLALLGALDNKEGVCLSVLCDGEPCAMFGVSPDPNNGEFGTIWMLGTERPFSNPFLFARASKDWVVDLCEPYEACGNWVWEENRTAIQWLKWLGFRFPEGGGTLNLGGKKFLFFVGPDKDLKS